MSFALDVVIFPFGGIVVDRYGRRAAGVPSLCGLGGGLALLGAAQSPPALVLASAVLGLSNGVSAGLIMTIGQDAAPAGGRAGRFLGLYKVCPSPPLEPHHPPLAPYHPAASGL